MIKQHQMYQILRGGVFYHSAAENINGRYAILGMHLT